MDSQINQVVQPPYDWPSRLYRLVCLFQISAAIDWDTAQQWWPIAGHAGGTGEVPTWHRDSWSACTVDGKPWGIPPVIWTTGHIQTPSWSKLAGWTSDVPHTITGEQQPAAASSFFGSLEAKVTVQMCGDHLVKDNESADSYPHDKNALISNLDCCWG